MANPLKWVEVSRSALCHNLGEFRRVVGPKVKLMAVVKSNAYGHGLIETATVSAAAGADWLGVNELAEGLRLREAGLETPILILGGVARAALGRLAEHDLAAVAYDPETIRLAGEAAERAGKPIHLHLKVETGLHRQGVLAEDLLPVARLVHEHPYLILEGVSSHFANIEDTTDHRYAMGQIGKFREHVDRLEAKGMKPSLCHHACSAAALVLPETHHDLVRVGIALYGLWPSKETLLAVLQRGDEAVSLVPALTWKSRIVQLKRVEAGCNIGYGCTEKTTHPTVIGIVPVGYYDGYDRGFSNVGQVLVRGKRSFVRGRVCMNMIMVDVTHVTDAAVEDEVVLLGSQGEERISADFLADQLGTINYEVVTRINESIPRVVVD